MQLSGGMFSTVAWSVATVALLTLTANALPTAPLDGSIHSRSDKTGLLMRRTDHSFSAGGEEIQNLAQTAYSQCLERSALEESERSGIPSTKRLASGAEKPTLYLAAKKGCYDDVFLTYGVLPKKSSGEALISRLRKPLKNGPEDLATRNTIANEIPRADPRQGTGGQNRGQGLNVNPTTLKEPSDRLDRHWVGSGRSGRGKPGRKQKYSQERSDEPEERRTPYYPLHVVW